MTKNSPRLQRVSRNLYVASNGRFRAAVATGRPRPNDVLYAWFDSRADAVAWQAENERRREAGEPLFRPEAERTGEPEPATVFFREYAERWLKVEIGKSVVADHGRHGHTGALRPSTISSYRERLDNHILPEFGTMLIPEITRDRISAWVTGLARQGYAVATQRELITTLSMLLRRAHVDGLCRANPAALVRPILPAQPKKALMSPGQRRHILTWAQVQRLAAATPYELRIGVWLAYLMGLRTGEIKGLRVRDVSLEPVVIELDGDTCVAAGMIHVSQQRARTAKLSADADVVVVESVEVVPYLKTFGSHRSLPIPEVLVAPLREYIERTHGPQPEPDALLVQGVNTGKPVCSSSWNATFRRAASRAGLGFDPAGEDGLCWRLTPHFGRANLNGWLAKLGVSGPVRSHLLGHRLRLDDVGSHAPLITDTVYWADDPTALVRAMEAVSRVVRKDLGELDADIVDEEWPGVTETSRRLDIHETTVRRLVAAGQLRGENRRDVLTGRTSLRIDPHSIEVFSTRASTPTPDGWISASRAAAILGSSPAQVARWGKDGRLPGVRVQVGRQSEWRFRESEVQESRLRLPLRPYRRRSQRVV